MTKNSSFTDKERAAWHEDRHRKRHGDIDADNSSVSGHTCINCGTPLSQGIPDGYEAALCDACESEPMPLLKAFPFRHEQSFVAVQNTLAKTLVFGTCTNHLD